MRRNKITWKYSQGVENERKDLVGNVLVFVFEGIISLCPSDLAYNEIASLNLGNFRNVNYDHWLRGGSTISLNNISWTAWL